MATLPLTHHQPSKPLDLTPEDRANLAQLTAGDRLAISIALAEAASRGLRPDGLRESRLVAPQTDEELLEAVEQLTGYHIPRVAVCVDHGHTSPAETFCDLFFERITNCLWIGNRGGGKTTNSGMLHGAKGRYNPAYKSAIAGAVQIQGHRAYTEFRRFTRLLGNEILKSLLSRTTWANGSLTEVLGGTVRALNGPHPYLSQMDEAELSTHEVLQEFFNMAQGDERHRAIQLLTSTRKRASGIVQDIVKECRQAERSGDEPPWTVRIFCVFETLSNVPNCRSAPENADRPEAELCNCHRMKRGTWDDGSERRFDQVCGGRAYKSDGFLNLEDAQGRFKTLSRFTWEAQQECLQPEIEGIVHKWYREKHRIANWLPYPAFGPVYRGWDWGGVNPHAVVWLQRLRVAVGLKWREVTVNDGDEPEWMLLPVLDEETEPDLVLPEGAMIQFDELYGSSDELGEFSDLGIKAVLKEEEWRMCGFDFVVDRDFCDPAGYVAKREVKKAVTKLIEQIEDDRVDPDLVPELNRIGLTAATHQIRVPEFRSIAAPRYESIRKHIEWGEDDMLYVVTTMCPRTDDEYEAYRWAEKKPGKNAPEDAVKEDDHAMDAKRYVIWNIMILEGRAQSEEPAAVDKAEPPSPPSHGPFAPQRVAPSESPTIADDGGLPSHLTGHPSHEPIPVGGGYRGVAYRTTRG